MVAREGTLRYGRCALIAATTMLGFVGGASADTGFVVENNSTFHGSIYVVNDYLQENSVSLCGPVIAQELLIENHSFNCYVPWSNLPPGAPGASSSGSPITLQNVPNSFTTD